MFKNFNYGCSTAIFFYAPDLNRFGAFAIYAIPYSMKGGIANG